MQKRKRQTILTYIEVKVNQVKYLSRRKKPKKKREKALTKTMKKREKEKLNSYDKNLFCSVNAVDVLPL